MTARMMTAPAVTMMVPMAAAVDRVGAMTTRAMMAGPAVMMGPAVTMADPVTMALVMTMVQAVVAAVVDGVTIMTDLAVMMVLARTDSY